MIKTLSYAGKNLAEFSMFFDSSKIYKKPLKQYSGYDIPNRSGKLYQPSNKYSNVIIEYQCYIRENFGENFTALINYLNSFDTYQRLEDTTDPLMYRMALFHIEVNANTGAFLKDGKFTLSFDCKPQTYYKSGEEWLNLPRTINNPSFMKARPLFRFENITQPFGVVANGTAVISYKNAVRMIINQTANGINFTANGTTLVVRKVGTPQETQMSIALGSSRLAAGQYRLTAASYGTLQVKAGSTVLSTGGTFTLSETTSVTVYYVITPTSDMPSITNVSLLLMPLGTLYIDCELMDCYIVYNGVAYSHNETVELPADYIELGESTELLITGGATGYIAPRWWRL